MKNNVIFMKITSFFYFDNMYKMEWNVSYNHTTKIAMWNLYWFKKYNKYTIDFKTVTTLVVTFR